MGIPDPHDWARQRLIPWRAGLLGDDELSRLVAHLDTCAPCRDHAANLAPEPGGMRGAHISSAVLGSWASARRTLRGLERELVRHHLERCVECRQDLEILGYEPRLERIPELETAPAVLAAANAPEIDAGEEFDAPGRTPSGERAERTAVIRIVKSTPRPRWWQPALIAWSSLATATAVVAIVVHARRPVVEGVPPPIAAVSPRVENVARARAVRTDGGLSLRIAPRPRSLKAPARGARGGRVNVIPVMGPVNSLALQVRPLNIPDTSLVMVSLLNADGDTLFAVRHRQWEFFPKRVLMIEGDESLAPGQYALVLASLITDRGARIPLMSRYRFELRPRP
jgi:hypothetical protein